MENVEHSKVVSTTSSSPKTTQNDCYDDDDNGGGEHVINQNQQTLEISNKNSNVLDLTESSSAKSNALNDSYIQQVELVRSKEPQPEEKPIDEQQAPVDLTSVNTTQIKTSNLEYQTEPFNLKMDALASIHPTNENAHTQKTDDILVAMQHSNSDALDLYKNCVNKHAPDPVEALQLEGVLANEVKTINEEAVVIDKTNKNAPEPHESILDLRINNVNEATQSPSVSDQIYQARLGEIKIENTLETADNALHEKEAQSVDIINSPPKLNGSHRYSPIENFESALEKPNFLTKFSTSTDAPDFVENMQEKSNDFNMLNPTIMENKQQKLGNDSFSNNFDNLAEHASETNNTGSANELNESRYSSLESLNSASTLRSSSSQQLIIDQPTEDDKVPPLRLKLKRKHRKSNSSVESSTQPAKRANVAIISADNLNTENFRDEALAVNNSPSLATTNELHSNELENSITSCSDPITQNTVVLTQFYETPSQTVEETLPSAPLCENRLLYNEVEVEENLNVFKPPTPSQYYKCATCGTFHENWSFFLHLQEKHDRFLCLYCIKCFPTAEKLALHLEIKHDLEQNHFNTEEAFRNSALIIHGYNLETRFLMCCTCQYIFRENAAFTEHACIEFMKSCLLCGQKGRHTNQCKANPLAKRRNKKKTRQKAKPPSLQTAREIEPTLRPPLQPQPLAPSPPLLPVMTEQDASIQQSQEQMAQKTPVRRQSDDSNSSSNMVIDESCNTNHSLQPNQINPFKALDDTERMEQEAEAAAAARREAAAEDAKANSAESLVNNVFKFKLRVPKEFQKPVDEEISTSESEHMETFEDETADINSNQVEFKNNKLVEEQTTTTRTTITPPIDEEQQQQATTNNEKSLPQSDDESIDDTAATAHLARILQEIEQTKLDIEKTKETLHHRHAQHAKSESAGSAVDVESNAAGVDAAAQPPTTVAADEHWTPTPPASPKLNVELNDVASSNEANFTPAAEYAQPIGEEQMEVGMEMENSATAEILPLNEQVDDTTKPDAVAVSPAPPDDGIEVANEDCLAVELQLDRPLDQFETVEFVRICLKAAFPYCLYCNHARRIAVNAESLVLHLIAQHRFTATVDSITAEELQPSTLVAKLKSFLPELHDQFMNSSSYCTIGEGRFTRHFNERIFECFQCRFVTSTHKELYLHNRKMHLRTAILCFMCRCNFYSFSEILCHICPGVPHRVSIFEIKFRCCLCDLTEIPSPFRLMVHLRKRHFACDVCLEDCRDQSKLSSHVWKHKLHHLCYRCGIAYRNKLDITKHLFWKHGTESALCKRCLQKRWPHVYHFCVPPAIFSCDVCQLCFSKAMYLTVHKRLHQNDFRYACTENGCQEKFISRKLLLKHSTVHETAETVKDEDVANAGEMHQKIEESDVKEAQEQKTTLDNETGGDAETDAAAKVKSETDSIKGEEGADKEASDNTNGNAVETPIQQPTQSPHATPNPTATEHAASTEQPGSEKKHKKRKKRAKESLEDLNLTAPNLSESGSSSESESETKSTIATSRQELALSPISEHGEQKVTEQVAGELSAGEKIDGNVLDIWKNFLQAQQLTGELLQYTDYTEDDYPTPKCLHVCISDHDYCAMFPQKQEVQPITTPPKSKHESTSGRTRNFSSSSEASSEDSSSSSSCSCGSNCSCSNGSSSSSSSGDSSDSSAVSATKKRLRKKSERSNRHRKSFSSSPLKPQQGPQQHNTSGDNVNVIDTDDNANVAVQLQDEADATTNAEEPKANQEPTINESDLETAESETDEEYYDEHPQKLATELLSQKRAQLMARTLLSPSHNFDIVENSRPSTPSLPEDVIYEKRQKKKKTKRDRKSTSNSKLLAATSAANELHEYLAATTAAQHNTMEAVSIDSQYNQNQANSSAYMPPQTLESTELRQMPPTTAANHYIPRISEGSSCSDADNSLKRSKRQRRPNKFYGYTSDDESMAPAALGQSLVIGMRAYKPLPPPQLVWDKEDLPTPDKSILNANKKPSRQTSTPNTLNAGAGSGVETSTKKKKTTAHRKRTTKHASENQKLPPIPRLKIRSAFLNKSIEASDLGLDYSSDSASSDIEQQSLPPPRKRTFPPKHSASAAASSSTFLPRYPPNQQLPQSQQQTAIVAAAPAPPLPLPPTPQTTAFNHKIPPALLPNPDFSTLQYFKANNIRYPIRPPAGARAAREGESVYCYCRCPYDEVSEMIACDGDSCLIEWFHFECVGIMLAPQGKWFCAECRPQYSEELYPTTTATGTATNFT